MMSGPAHKIFIERYLDLNKAEERLARYNHIADHFKLNRLNKCSEKKPYYCHYFMWRLGTWKDEKWFEFFDELLAHASSLDNWGTNKKSFLSDCKFEVFWSLVWELQMAKLLSGNNDIKKVEWMKSGPDLRVDTKRGGSFYVECYAYRKSFGIEEFIGEIFRHIHPNIKVEHMPCLPFSLTESESFLNALFEPYIDSRYLEGKFREAEKEYPVLLPVPKGAKNFYVYLEGDDPENYVPGRLPNGCGDPEKYLEVVFKEALDNKRKSNELLNHRPNMLAVNLLLGVDFQMAFSRQKNLGNAMPPIDYRNTFDSVFHTACGIDKIPSFDQGYLQIKSPESHPVSSIVPR